MLHGGDDIHKAGCIAPGSQHALNQLLFADVALANMLNLKSSVGANLRGPPPAKCCRSNARQRPEIAVEVRVDLGASGQFRAGLIAWPSGSATPADRRRCQPTACSLARVNKSRPRRRRLTGSKPSLRVVGFAADHNRRSSWFRAVSHTPSLKDAVSRLTSYDVKSRDAGAVLRWSRSLHRCRSTSMHTARTALRSQ